MTKEELIKKLQWVLNDLVGDEEVMHVHADRLLIEYINDPDIAEAYEAIPKWYA